jgi:endonuclease G
VAISCGDEENDYNLGGNTPKPSSNTGANTGNNSGSSSSSETNTGNNSGSSSSSEGPNENDAALQAALARLEFPKTRTDHGSFVIVHTGKLNDKNGETGINYSVEWDPEIHAQRWSCYQLYSSVLDKNTQRYSASNDGQMSPASQYPHDSFVDSKYLFTKDSYKGSGYDHGHICPSNDRLASAESNYQTFFMTNMQPQRNGFNAGIWADMEQQLRLWAAGYDTLYVCKGGTIDRAEYIKAYLGSGANKIPIPKYFFMAVLAKKGNDFKATGFWIDQDNHPSSNLKYYAVTIQTLQSHTGIDFFCNLPDDIENTVENIAASQMEKEWTWYK